MKYPIGTIIKYNSFDEKSIGKVISCDENRLMIKWIESNLSLKGFTLKYSITYVNSWIDNNLAKIIQLDTNIVCKKINSK